MTLDISPATLADYEIVRALAPYYIYDMAEHAGWPFPDSGAFEAGDQFAPYWGKPRARPWPAHWKGYPFLARMDAHPAGFALVKEMAPGLFDMGEFFVARQHRRQRVGERLAVKMFETFRGNWEVREMLTNLAAQAFWRRVIREYTGGDFTDAREALPDYDGREFVIQRFNSRAG
ncbi:MAG TPA: GNAT family N-acetyltransferase [Rhizomicrobium sp.]|nr:GNAT family N-acetyltransferase [Rhizomicrobium sp.]